MGQFFLTWDKTCNFVWKLWHGSNSEMERKRMCNVHWSVPTIQHKIWNTLYLCMSKLFKTKATLQRVMSIHWKIYHYLQPNFVKIEMLLDICFICIFLTNWFDSILLRSKDLEQIPGLITNAIHSNSQSLRTKYIYSSVYLYDLFFSNWKVERPVCRISFPMCQHKSEHWSLVFGHQLFQWRSYFKLMLIGCRKEKKKLPDL